MNWFETEDGYETKPTFHDYKGVIEYIESAGIWIVYVVGKTGLPVSHVAEEESLDNAKTTGGYMVKSAVQRRAVETAVRF